MMLNLIPGYVVLETSYKSTIHYSSAKSELINKIKHSKSVLKTLNERLKKDSLVSREDLKQINELKNQIQKLKENILKFHQEKEGLKGDAAIDVTGAVLKTAAKGMIPMSGTVIDAATKGAKALNKSGAKKATTEVAKEVTKGMAMQFINQNEVVIAVKEAATEAAKSAAEQAKEAAIESAKEAAKQAADNCNIS